MPLLEQACRVGEQPGSSFQTNTQLPRSERSAPSRGELQRQRDPVEALTQLDNSVAQLSVVDATTEADEAIHEQLDGSCPAERLQRHPDLAVHSQRHTTRDEHVHVRAALDEHVDRGSGCCENQFAIVEHEEDFSIGQPGNQAVQRRTVQLAPHSDTLRDRVVDGLGDDAGEADEVDATRELGDELLSDLGGETRLPQPARPGEHHHAAPQHTILQMSHLGGASPKAAFSHSGSLIVTEPDVRSGGNCSRPT